MRQATEFSRSLELPFEVTDHLYHIISAPCFQWINTAARLRAHGHDLPTGAENDQGHGILCALSYYYKHGERWAEFMADDLWAETDEEFALRVYTGGGRR
jgi:hypothetical protein